MPRMKPVLFNTEMVKANLEGRKTTTRRVVKPLPPDGARLELVGDRRHAMDVSIEIPGPDDHRIYTPPYVTGDILYVREKFAGDGFDGREYHYVYWTDVDDCGRVVWGDLEKGEWAPSSDYHWHPSIHMPKEAARIFLRVTDVRVERLKEITDKGARAEGCGDPDVIYYNGWLRCEFAELWDSTVAPEKRDTCGWAANPWVWVIEYERCEKPKEGQV